MKRLITLALVAICTAISCSKFDDSAIWDKLNNHETRLAYLEEVCKKMNTDIVNLQTIVTALETNDYIVNASPLVTGDGHTFIFKSGKSVVIYNGKDGKDGIDGNDGVTPTISVMKDVDGVYYWTVNSEWILVNGQKVRASAVDGKDGQNGTNGTNGTDGKDGITPKFMIEDEYWYVSYDNGQSWEKLGKATGEDGQNGSNGVDGDSIFSKIEQDDESVYFYLANGTMITLSKHHLDIIQFEDLAVKAICCKNWDTNEDGELSYSEAETVMEIGTEFKGNTSIIAFNEFKYFTNVLSVPEDAFSRCTNLWKLTLPSSIATIGEMAFYDCKSLSNIKLPENLVSIKANAFAGCTKLKSIKIPINVVELGYGAFVSCSGLLNVELGDNVVNIGSAAFHGCTSLETLKIGRNVTEIGSEAFYGCTGKLILCCNLPNSNSRDGSLLKGSKFSELIIEDNVLQIGSYAFYQLTSLTKITIGSGVNIVGEYAFSGNNSLTSIYCKALNPPTLGGYAFNSTVSNRTIYVPNSSLTKYINDSGWLKYSSDIAGYDF